MQNKAPVQGGGLAQQGVPDFCGTPHRHLRGPPLAIPRGNVYNEHIVIPTQKQGGFSS